MISPHGEEALFAPSRTMSLLILRDAADAALRIR